MELNLNYNNAKQQTKQKSRFMGREEVTDAALKQVDSWDEGKLFWWTRKKVPLTSLQVQSSSNGLNLLSGVIPSGSIANWTKRTKWTQTENAPILREDESTRTDKFIRKPIDKKKVDEIYNFRNKTNRLDEFAKSHFVLDNLSQTEAIKQLTTYTLNVNKLKTHRRHKQ